MFAAVHFARVPAHTLRAGGAGLRRARMSTFSRLREWHDEFNRKRAEKKAETRAKLQEELHKPYFHELHEYRKGEAKGAETRSKPLVPAAEARAFPTVATTAVADAGGAPVDLPGLTLGSPALYLVAFRDSAQEGIDSWIRAFDDGAVTRSSKVRLVEVNVIESALLRGLKGVMASSLAKQTPAEHVKRLFLFTGDHAMFREQLDIENRLVAHAFLVDAKGRVRWRARDTATEDEVRSLAHNVRQLLNNR